MTGYDPDVDENENHESTITQYEKTDEISTEDYYTLVKSLNCLQTYIHQFVVDWCMKHLLNERNDRAKQFFVHLTGGGGVGKSHALKCIIETTNRMLSKNGQKPPHVIISAPTGILN